MADTFDFGLVGLGVMGRNFILNVVDHGFSAMGLDTDPDKVKALKKEGKGKSVNGSTSKDDFIKKLSKPRKIMMLVPAGAAVDSVIDDLSPLLDKGDLLIDGGNSFFEDTNRREESLSAKGIHFIGAGVSGGAKGARFGPSIMPGGDQKAYKLIQPIFESASAKVNDEPCVEYMGSRSAGNYVKMVHNGIEYGLMQLISEIYDIMHRGMDVSNRALSYTFSEWNQGRLQSFLLEITSEILIKRDDETGRDLVEMILDKAKQKGTGKWTSQNAMDLGIAIPSIDAAVAMRELSSQKEDREELEKSYPKGKVKPDSDISVEELEKTLFFSFIITYSQGLSQLLSASKEYEYGLNLEKTAKIWRGGCIIRAALLEDIRVAYDKNPELPTLLFDESFRDKLNDSSQAVRKVLQFSIDRGIPTMSLSACLNYFDSYTTGRLPLNLIQAQRDHFGSHTYERIDKEGIFHTEW